jgi:hypothetical protein
MHRRNGAAAAGRGRNIVVALVTLIAAALAFGMVGAFGSEQDRGPRDCPPGGYNGPGYGGPGYGGPGYGGPGYGGPGYGGPGYGGPGYGGPGYGGPPGCPPCPPPGNGNGNGHDKDRGEGHDRGQGVGHCKDDIPEARFTYDPKPARAGEPVHFDASASDDDPSDPIVSYQWDFDGDGQFDDGTGREIDHVFAEPGKYDVGLLVTDDDGDTDTTVETVHVLERPKPPKSDPPRPKDPPAPPPKEDPKPDPPKAKEPAKPSVKAAGGQKLSEVISKGLVVIASCTQSCQAELSVAVQSKGPKVKGASKAGTKLTGGTEKKLRIKLSKKARRALKRSRKATFVISMAARDSGGNRATTTRKASIRR